MACLRYDRLPPNFMRILFTADGARAGFNVVNYRIILNPPGRACACLFNFGNVLFLLTFRFILSSELQESVGTSTIVLLIRVYI